MKLYGHSAGMFGVKVTSENNKFTLLYSDAGYGELAWKELAPHKICGYIYALANSFNAFYHNVKILGEEDQEKQKNYIAHLALTWRILTDAIQVLGFSAPERM